MSMKEQIRHALASAFAPQHLEVHNESHMHSRGQDSHFKVVVVSEAFAGLRPVQRHQKVYAALGELMAQFHALAQHTYTPEEWAATGQVPDSPTCLGGSKHDGH